MSIPQALLQINHAQSHAVPVSHAVHDSAIRSFALRFDHPVRRELLQRFLSTLVDLRGADLLRVKGFVPVEDGAGGGAGGAPCVRPPAPRFSFPGRR